MNIVTGGNGFLGRGLSNYFIQNKIKFSCISRIELNKLSNKTNIEKFHENKLNSIIHLAAANNNKGLSYDQFYETNVDLTLKLYKIAEMLSADKFIFFSTINTQKENLKNDFYSKTKKIAEDNLRRLASNSNVKLFILKLPPVIDYETKGNLKLIYSFLKLNVPIFLPEVSKTNKRSIIEKKDINNLVKEILGNKINTNTYMVSKINDLSTYELISRMRDNINSKSMILIIPTIFFFPLKVLSPSVYMSLFSDHLFDHRQEGAVLKVHD